MGDAWATYGACTKLDFDGGLDDVRADYSVDDQMSWLTGFDDTGAAMEAAYRGNYDISKANNRSSGGPWKPWAVSGLPGPGRPNWARPPMMSFEM